MIIRIGRYEELPTPKYIAFLQTDAGAVLLRSTEATPVGFQSLSYLASKLKDLLSVKTPENIKIEYPPDMGVGQDPNTPRICCEHHASLDRRYDGRFAEPEEITRVEDTPLIPPPSKPWFKPWFKSISYAKTAAETLADIKLQVHNVAERATLDDYEKFVFALEQLVDRLRDDVGARNVEANAPGGR